MLFSAYGEKNLIVIADPDRIEQVLVNFITNAVKYSQDKSLIEIEVFRKKQAAVVSVSDKGIGISKDKMPFVFDRFFQANSRPCALRKRKVEFVEE